MMKAWVVRTEIFSVLLYGGICSNCFALYLLIKKAGPIPTKSIKTVSIQAFHIPISKAGVDDMPINLHYYRYVR